MDFMVMHLYNAVLISYIKNNTYFSLHYLFIKNNNNNNNINNNNKNNNNNNNIFNFDKSKSFLIVSQWCY